MTIISQLLLKLQLRSMSFNEAISKTLWFGRVLGLMPSHGVISKETLKSVKSFKYLHSLLIFIGSTIFFVTTFARSVDQRNFSLDRIMTLTVYFTNILTVILFFKLGKVWQNLIKSWTFSEENLQQPEWKNLLTHQLNLRLLFIASSSIGEFVRRQTFEKLISMRFSWIHIANSINVIEDDAMWFRLHQDFLSANLSISLLLSAIQPSNWICFKTHELHHHAVLGLQGPICHEYRLCFKVPLSSLQRNLLGTWKNASRVLDLSTNKISEVVVVSQQGWWGHLWNYSPLVCDEYLLHLRSLVQRIIVRIPPTQAHFWIFLFPVRKEAYSMRSIFGFHFSRW